MVSVVWNSQHVGGEVLLWAEHGNRNTSWICQTILFSFSKLFAGVRIVFLSSSMSKTESDDKLDCTYGLLAGPACEIVLIPKQKFGKCCLLWSYRLPREMLLQGRKWSSAGVAALHGDMAEHGAQRSREFSNSYCRLLSIAATDIRFSLNPKIEGNLAFLIASSHTHMGTRAFVLCSLGWCENFTIASCCRNLISVSEDTPFSLFYWL